MSECGGDAVLRLPADGAFFTLVSVVDAGGAGAHLGGPCVTGGRKHLRLHITAERAGGFPFSVGFAVGGSFGVGVDAVFGEARDGSPVYGVQVSGLGPSTPFPEGHGELTKTVVIPLDWLPTYVKKEIYNYANDFWTTNRDYISVIERVDAR